jgi:hypothetical protein
LFLCFQRKVFIAKEGSTLDPPFRVRSGWHTFTLA